MCVFVYIYIAYIFIHLLGLPRWLMVKNLPAGAGDTGDVCLIPGSGISPREGKGNPLQYSSLGNPMDRGAWWAIVHDVKNSWTLSSVQFSCSVVSDSLWPHESHHARPPCPSLSPGVHSNSRPSSRWCHPAISSSVIPFSSCPPAASQHQNLFQWVNSSHEVAKVPPHGGGASALASFLPRKSQGWSPSE